MAGESIEGFPFIFILASSLYVYSIVLMTHEFFVSVHEQLLIDTPEPVNHFRPTFSMNFRLSSIIVEQTVHQ